MTRREDCGAGVGFIPAEEHMLGNKDADLRARWTAAPSKTDLPDSGHRRERRQQGAVITLAEAEVQI